jgi:hypothetical protein
MIILVKKFRFALAVLTVLFLIGCSRVHFEPVNQRSIETSDNIIYTLLHYDSELDERFRYGDDFTDLALNTVFLLLVENSSEQLVELNDIDQIALTDLYSSQHALSDELRVGAYTIEQIIESEFGKPVSSDQNNASSVVVTSKNQGLVNEINDLKKEIKLSRQKEAAYRRTYVIKNVKEKILNRVTFKGGKLFPQGHIQGLLVFEPMPLNTLSRFKISLMSHQNKVLSFRFNLVIED